jgi:acetyl-CoA synthetase
LPDLKRIFGCRCGESADEFWNLLRQGSDAFDMVETLADDPACLIYTSGTTGPPKGALLDPGRLGLDRRPVGRVAAGA